MPGVVVEELEKRFEVLRAVMIATGSECGLGF